MTIDVSKHAEVFNPNWLKGHVAVIGVGALGSAVALNLAKLGIGSKMILYDDDNVGAHNVANQYLYGNDDIGKYKVMVASDMLARLTDAGSAPIAQPIKVAMRSDIASCSYVFVCVDSMAARKKIFEKCVYMNPVVSYFCEGRMNARDGSVYGFNPLDMGKSKAYIDGLYPDSDVPRDGGGCSMTQSIGATAMTLACQMTWHFMDTMSGDEKRKPYEEIALRVPNLTVHSKGPMASH